MEANPRYRYSAAAAAEILNLHFDTDQPKPVLFSRILQTILGAMHRADDEVREQQQRPSDN